MGDLSIEFGIGKQNSQIKRVRFYEASNWDGKGAWHLHLLML